MNDYLDPPASAEEQAELLTRSGFQVEGREEVELPGGRCEGRLDVEIPSNRGDVLCHVGLAREIAAASHRTLKLPHPKLKATGPPASKIVRVTNREPELCSLYTARVLRGVHVGPSPKWLTDRLIVRGSNPHNTIVDASNFVLFELGQPTHVFDLATLRGPEIIIRRARPDELFLPIGETTREIKLSADDLVIADADRAVAVAGVKGGALTAVSESTRDILIETATFSPASVRATSRRLNIHSDSSFRFERGVHPAQISAAADRLVELIVQLCGGELCHGEVADGQPIPPERDVSMRCERCRKVLGTPVKDNEMVSALDRLGFSPVLNKGVIHCTVPYIRLDIEREVDLIEEVGRLVGHDVIPVFETIRIRVTAPQSTESARRAASDAMVGMGYVETVTHTLIGEAEANAFLAPDVQPLRLRDDPAAGEPVLRPSILPSLLRVYAHNRDNGMTDIKLFESAATFGRWHDSHVEFVNLAMLRQGADNGQALRGVRGVIDRLIKIILGRESNVQVVPDDRIPWFHPGALVTIDGRNLGLFGLIAPRVAEQFGLQERVFGAEIGLPQWYDRYPPETEASAMPAFPAIERDVSAIVDESLRWDDVRKMVEKLGLENMESVEFVTTFRGKQIGEGKKSLTLRTRFRAADRTLRHHEADRALNTLLSALEQKFGAVIR